MPNGVMSDIVARGSSMKRLFANRRATRRFYERFSYSLVEGGAFDR
jgi:hypothetical protein